LTPIAKVAFTYSERGNLASLDIIYVFMMLEFVFCNSQT